MLPAEWQKVADRAGLTEVHTLAVEKDQLEERGTEARFKELEGARHGVEALRQQIAELEAEGEQVPPEARRELREVQALLREARQRLKEREDALLGARQELRQLADLKAQRQQIQAQVLEVEKEHNVLSQLAQLLGRDRLQLYLVRQAERQI